VGIYHNILTLGNAGPAVNRHGIFHELVNEIENVKNFLGQLPWQ
jgi:hypothetical protein